MYPESVTKKYQVGIVPHFCDLNNSSIKKLRETFSSALTIISPLDKPSIVVRRIKECEVILSSSLHGLIIADAFGIPSRRWVDRRTMPNIEFHDYKFEDYNSSIGIEESPIILSGNESIQELIEITSLKPQHTILELISGLDEAMKEISTQFKK